MYQKMTSDCKKSLKRQFDFSKSELDQIESFISNNMGQPAKDILSNLMDDDNLSDRQKVLVSYILGTSVGVESTRRDFEGINFQKAEPIVNMRVGQAG